MSGFTTQKVLHTNDGTEITVDSWLRTEDTVTQSPGDSNFTATCPEHGEISSGYIWMLVGYEVQDHANDHHEGIQNSKDILEIGPSIQL
jgi:hypothetical protein